MAQLGQLLTGLRFVHQCHLHGCLLQCQLVTRHSPLQLSISSLLYLILLFGQLDSPFLIVIDYWDELVVFEMVLGGRGHAVLYFNIAHVFVAIFVFLDD